ncbi:HAD family phosphatase [Alkalicella caledoniensis]|uniref:HAD family phosphatase n=1 Tax=Alkalicella caledoniensis TaxID=2731377 RepID=A0A7G9W5N2_ALKCA|nr:Cof-type HAD-IIB family hydrolase [Alkalicella caledoniensis]QNO13994.1 HAD family phosphatase [Alkalicella caledoniensis]
MDIKLICIDLDGTLLNSENAITPRSKDALLKATQLGVHVAVSTGRTFVDADYYSSLVGLKTPIISSNGAYIKEKDQGKVIYQNVLDENVLTTILEICKRYGISPCMNTPFKKYHGKDFSELFKIFDEKAKKFNRIITVYKRELVENMAEWKDIIKKEKDNIIKCELYSSNKEIILKIRQELDDLDDVEAIFSIHHSIEVTCKGVSKARGVEILAGFYNLKPENVMAIGDSENDLSMIKYAGLGAAMGNSIDMIKEASDYVTDSNDDEGVAKAIEKFVLKMG